MHFLVDFGHPGHVHFFRHAIAAWRKAGHQVTLVTRDIPINHALLKAYGLEAETVSRPRPGKVGRIRELFEHSRKLSRVLKGKQVDAAFSIGGAFTVRACKKHRIPHYMFTDTEAAGAANRYAAARSIKVITPECFNGDFGEKHLRYPGTHETAYLHPEVFTADPAVPAKYGLDPEKGYVVVRWIAWEALHDLDEDRWSLQQREQILTELKSEREILLVEENAEQIAPEDFHHLLAFATFCISEGSTTAIEAALLGTFAWYAHPLRAGIIEFLEERQRLGQVDDFSDASVDAMLHVMKKPWPAVSGRPGVEQLELINTSDWLAELEFLEK